MYKTKEIEICGTKYVLKCSTGTKIEFQTQSGKKLLSTMQNYAKSNKEDCADEMVEDGYMLLYIMINEAKDIGENKNFDYSYLDWRKSLDRFEFDKIKEAFDLIGQMFRGSIQ